MKDKKALGRKGEEIAAEFLEKEGLQIVARNWRHRRAEIDIIARDGEALVFVEVKYRSSDQYTSPEGSLSVRQIRMIADAAAAYAEESGHEWEVRFDIIGILQLAGAAPEIRWYPDAFFPEE